MSHEIVFIFRNLVFLGTVDQHHTCTRNGDEVRTMMTMADVKFYEQGRAPGDFLLVQDAIQRRREWAIVLDRTGCANFLSPFRPSWLVVVNGVLVRTCVSRADAEWEMHGYLDGWYWIPWDVGATNRQLTGYQPYHGN